MRISIWNDHYGDSIGFQSSEASLTELADEEPLRFALQANPSAYKLANLIKAQKFSELRVELDTDLAAVWCFQQHKIRPSFVIPMLREIRILQRTLQDFHRDYPEDASNVAKFLIWASDKKGIFNLGGDLKYFIHLIQEKNFRTLRAYAMSCIDVCYTNYMGLSSPMIVGAFVAGDALGGGFESALSCDFIIAEEQAKFGLPEILYGLFPGMGAYTLLSRRVGQARAESLILSGNIYPANEILTLGLLEDVAPQNQGRSLFNRHLAKLLRRFDASLSVYRARRRSFPINFQEMADIADDWVRVAASLSQRDLRKMQKIAAAQSHR